MNDQALLQNLTDFRDVRLSCNKSQNELSTSKNGNNYNIQMQNNDRLLKNFKQLRQQLKVSNKDCQKYISKLNQQESQIERYKCQEKDQVANLYQIKHQMSSLQETNQNYRLKLEYLQEVNRGFSQREEELEYLKITVCELKEKLERKETENAKIMEVGIIEKVELEQKIRKLESAKESDLEYVQEMEMQTSKLREKNTKLENELKKAEIRYDEQIYNKKWVAGGFEKQHLSIRIGQLEKENSDLLAKHQREKQKRGNLEKKVMDLEEMTGLWSVKAETYEFENKNLHKRIKKYDRKLSQTKNQAAVKIEETLVWQEKFLKSVAIAEELISRVKREIYGDTVSLAKSCEFKLNKLKEEKQPFTKSQVNKISPKTCKVRSKSKPITPILVAPKTENMENTQIKPYPQISPNDKFDSHLNEARVNIRLSNKLTDQSVTGAKSSHSLDQTHNIEHKIRRQREEMQKRIKERMLYRKIEVANSPDKKKLREQYFQVVGR